MNTISFPKMGLEFKVNSVAFSIGSFDIAWYAVIIAVGFLLAVWYVLSRVRKFGIHEDRAMDAIIFGMLGGIVGARIYFVIFSWDMYKDNLMEIFNTRSGGLAIYGGIIGAMLVGGLVCKIRKVKILPMFDMTVLGFLIGQSIGRWGNFVNVEAYGSNTNSFFGMMSSGTVNLYDPVHPCFLYESIWCLIGFVLLHIYSKHRKFDGEVTLMYMIWYGLGRMCIEGLRVDSLYWGPFRVSQMLSAVIVAFALITIGIVRSKIVRNNDKNYLKLYVDTDESKEMIAAIDEKLNDKSKKSSKKISEEIKSDDKKPNDDLDIAETSATIPVTILAESTVAKEFTMITEDTSDDSADNDYDISDDGMTNDAADTASDTDCDAGCDTSCDNIDFN